MKAEDFLTLKSGFCSRIVTLSAKSFLNHKECNELIFLKDGKETQTMEKSLLKLFKSFPIQVVITYDENKNHLVVRGTNDVLNIMKFIEEDISIELQGQTLSFNTFDEKTKDYFLHKECFFVTIVSQRSIEASPLLNTNALIELLQEEL